MPDIDRILPTGAKRATFTVALASGGTITIGNTYLVQDTWCVAYNTSDAASRQTMTTGGSIYGTVVALAGALIVYIYNCEKIMMRKKQATGEAFLIGDNVYVDPADNLVSPNAVTGYIKIGICVRDADDDAARVMVDLKGDAVEI